MEKIQKIMHEIMRKQYEENTWKGVFFIEAISQKSYLYYKEKFERSLTIWL
jgi:hypothetical protein